MSLSLASQTDKLHNLFHKDVWEPCFTKCSAENSAENSPSIVPTSLSVATYANQDAGTTCRNSAVRRKDNAGGTCGGTRSNRKEGHIEPRPVS